MNEENDDFQLFNQVAPDLTRTGKPRRVEEELSRKGWQEATIDNFEKQLGIFSSVDKAPENRIVKTRVFQLEYDKDAKLLTSLMNSPKHKILYWKDTWTVAGDYRVFAVYSELVDPETTSKTEKDE